MNGNQSAAQLSKFLFELARVRAETSGRTFETKVEKQLKEMTNKAGAELAKVTNEELRKAEIRVAEFNIIRLIELALEAAERINGYTPNLLEDGVFAAVKLRFCPCRPFC